MAEVENNIINFPITAEMKCRHWNNKLDKEIQEIHEQVDREIAEQHGSIEGLGKYIIKQVLRINHDNRTR